MKIDAEKRLRRRIMDEKKSFVTKYSHKRNKTLKSVDKTDEKTNLRKEILELYAGY